MPSGKVVPYKAKPVQLTVAQLATFSAACDPDVGRAERIDIRGTCPVCTHDVHYIVHEQEYDPAVGGVEAKALPPAGTDFIESEGEGGESATLQREAAALLRSHSQAGSLDRAFTCDCAYAHNASHVGCGAWFALHVAWVPSGDGKLVATPGPSGLPITHYEQAAADAADGAAASELARLRSAATSWRTGLAALLALVPTLVVVKGTETADKLKGIDKAVVGIPIIVGAVLAVTAALLAMRAAFGPLRFQPTARDAAKERDDEAHKTLRYLKATGALTIGALVFLGFSIAWAWQAPTSSPASFSVTKKDGSVVCGTLAGVTPAALHVKTSGGQVTSIQLADVVSTSFATGC